MFRSLALKVGLPAVSLLLALGAGWWFFIREDNRAQKDAAAVTDEVRQAARATPTALPAATGSTPAASPGAAAAGVSTIRGQAYRLVPGQAQAWYLAPEKLARLPTSSVAKGTTRDVTGEVHITNEGLDPSVPTTFTVKLTSLQSDEGMRDRRVQSALETPRFPVATFTARSLTGLPATFGAEGIILQLTGTLDLHGVQREVTWELKVTQDGDIISVLGTLKFRYSDFNITKPDIAGFVTVEDEVTVQVQLFLAKA